MVETLQERCTYCGRLKRDCPACFISNPNPPWDVAMDAKDSCRLACKVEIARLNGLLTDMVSACVDVIQILETNGYGNCAALLLERIEAHLAAAAGEGA